MAELWDASRAESASADAETAEVAEPRARHYWLWILDQAVSKDRAGEQLRCRVARVGGRQPHQIASLRPRAW